MFSSSTFSAVKSTTLASRLTGVVAPSERKSIICSFANTTATANTHAVTAIHDRNHLVNQAFFHFSCSAFNNCVNLSFFAALIIAWESAKLFAVFWGASIEAPLADQLDSTCVFCWMLDKSGVTAGVDCSGMISWGWLVPACSANGFHPKGFSGGLDPVSVTGIGVSCKSVMVLIINN